MLNSVVIIDSGGTYVTQYPQTSSDRAQLHSGFFIALDGMLRYFGESFRKVSEVRGQNYIGLLRDLGRNFRVFGLFTIEEESQVDRYIRPVFRFIVDQLCSAAAYGDYLGADMIDNKIISYFSRILNDVCEHVKRVLEIFTELDVIYETLYSKYGDRVVDIMLGQLGGLSRFVGVEKEGFYLHSLSDIKIVEDLASNVVESLRDLLKAEKIEVAPRVRHEEVIGDIIVSLISIFGDKFVRVISGFLSGSDIIVIGNETLLNLFLRAAPLFEVVPYVHTDDIQLIYLPNTSVLISLKFYQEIPKGKSTAIVVDGVRRRISGGVDMFLAKKMYREIIERIQSGSHPRDVYRVIKDMIDGLRDSIYAVIDFVRSGNNIGSEEYYGLLKRLEKYEDLATLKAIFTIAIKLYPSDKVRLYELYLACKNDIFPYIRILEV